MNLFWKIAIGAAFAAFLIGGGFAWHLKIVYNSWVASTSNGEPLFEREVLEDYGQQILGDLVLRDVKVAIVSRSGQPRDQLPKGINYTHSAFWLYTPNYDEAGNEIPAYKVHNLYHGEKNRLLSSLVVDDPADFLRLTRERDVGILIPDEATQTALMDFVRSDAYDDVHQVNYSLISNPYDTRFQNCNEFMLDAMASLFWETSDPAAIKARYQGVLKPTQIETSFVRRLFGPMIDERLIMDDQDKTVLTTTRQTLADFLDSEGRLHAEYALMLKSAHD